MSSHDQRRQRAGRRPETSNEAAASVLPFAPTLQLRVLDHLRACGAHGATDDEGELALGLKPQTYTPRRGELVKLGLVIDTGARRRTASGYRAAVWCAVGHAVAAVTAATPAPIEVRP